MKIIEYLSYHVIPVPVSIYSYAKDCSLYIDDQEIEIVDIFV
jgi:hypothetical protein